jgi:membrane protein
LRDISPESPEARRKRLATAKAHGRRLRESFRRGSRPWEVMKRVAVGVYSDGFIHAGNLAYLALLSIFPFVIVAAAVTRLFGQTEEGLNAVNALLSTMPKDVAEVLQRPIRDVLEARSGSLLWLGALVGLWSTGSFIETIRDIIRRAYGVSFSRPFWEYRLGSAGMIIASVIIAMIAFAFSVFLSSIQEFIVARVPGADELVSLLTLLRAVPALVLFGALYVLFYVLTPKRYLRRRLVGAHHRPAAGRAGEPRRLRPHLWQPRRRHHRPDLLLPDRPRPGDRRRAQRCACGDADA